MLDLTALDETTSPAPSAETGEPLRATLDRFYRDEEQPRFKFDAEKLKQFAEGLKDRGVMHAIVVRPPDESGPNKGKMKIVHGERRWRGSTLAGLPDIPYVIKADERIFDDYSQVIENQLREGLDPLELAIFIQKKVAKGDKKKYIAKNVGIHDTEIPYYLSMVESPGLFRELFESGRCTSPQYIYKLVKLHEKYPKEVELFCDEAEEITGKTIAALSDSLTGKLNNIKSDPVTPTSLNLDKVTGAGGGNGGGGSDPIANSEQSPGHTIPLHNPANEKVNTGSATPSDPTKIKKPLLTATLKQRDVMVLLHKRPTTPGLVFVKYEDDASEEEVETGKLKNWTLQESFA